MVIDRIIIEHVVIISFLVAALWWAKTKIIERVDFLEVWRIDHDKWASSKSDLLSQQILTDQRLATLMEVMDKRVSRLEEFWMKEPEK